MHWKNNVMTIGLGNKIGVGEIMTYFDMSPISVNYLGVSTYSGNGTSYWTIPASFYIPGNSTYLVNLHTW